MNQTTFMDENIGSITRPPTLIARILSRAAGRTFPSDAFIG
jgi:hypothetical protein